MKVAITGASGLIGSALAPALEAAGHSVLRLVRRTPRAGQAEVAWDPDAGHIDRAGLEGVDGVVHLAGLSLTAGRWTPDFKRRLRHSRVAGTRLVCEALAALRRPPQVLISGSAVGYYGDRGDQPLDEDSPPGTDFLAETAREWEAATAPAEQAGIRVVRSRTGIVLSIRGGALPRMLLPFRLGLGGPMGSGRQYWSWIAMEDLIAFLKFALTSADLVGPVNAVVPQSVPQREFARALGRALSRPALFPAPAFALRLLLGEMADAALLASARVVPKRLHAAGFDFHYPELAMALRHELEARSRST